MHEKIIISYTVIIFKLAVNILYPVSSKLSNFSTIIVQFLQLLVELIYTAVIGIYVKIYKTLCNNNL